MTADGYALGRRPALDALRGVAILLVLWGHSNWETPRGFATAGVTLFFVLSGFLITRLLLEEHDTQGTVSLRSFWVKRVRRIVPAATLFLLSMAAAGASPQDVAIAALYLADVPAVAGSGLPGLGHMWSLSLEEQFYLIWPPVVVLALARWRGWTAAGVLVAALSVVAYRFLIAPVPTYSAAGRGDALLLGCLLALVIARAPHRFVRVATFAGGLLVVLDCWRLDLDGNPLYLTLTAFAALLLVWGAATSSDGPRGSKPLRFLGRISYGVYLWHYPIAVAMAPRFGPLVTFPITLGVSSALGTLSYRLVEQPFMTRGRHRALLLATEGLGTARSTERAVPTNRSGGQP